MSQLDKIKEEARKELLDIAWDMDESYDAVEKFKQRLSDYIDRTAQATRESDIEVVESFIKRQESHPSISVKGDWIGQPPVVQSDDAARIAQALRNEEV